ncbi:MAG: biopolymer transporter ExbD [Candidatus Latescibacteria bacterium]|nr:biopolymer transporter ExbD [Candidatus Latescibacterota bacterium]
MQFQNGPPRRPAINVTSLIDVLFLLLTFFIITTRFVDQAALKVELPKMKNNDQVQHTRKYVLNISSEGVMQFDGKSLQEDDLRAKLTDLSGEVDEAGGLVLRADLNLSHGEVMRFYDLIRGAGIKRIAIATSEPVP